MTLIDQRIFWTLFGLWMAWAAFDAWAVRRMKQELIDAGRLTRDETVAYGRFSTPIVRRYRELRPGSQLGLVVLVGHYAVPITAIGAILYWAWVKLLWPATRILVSW